MNRIFRTPICAVITLGALLAGRNSNAADILITSNDFDAFATAVQGAPSGSTISFDLGANSTIHFTHAIDISNDISLIGNGAVTFDGGGTTTLFEVDGQDSFTGFTFQNGYAQSGGGAILSSGLATIHDSVFIKNSAVNFGGALAGNVSVYGSLFTQNHAGNVGGAISSNTNSNILVENSTFYANSAGNVGGAIQGGTGKETLRNDTIVQNTAGNVAGGVENNRSGVLSIESTIIAGNYAGNVYPDLNSDGQFLFTFSVNKSLIGDPSGTNLVNGAKGNLIGNGVTVNGFPIIHLVGPLADNGGLTPTMALLDFNGMTNPAINTGSNPDLLLYDQRGMPFARSVGGGVDMGAFERQAPEPSTVVSAVAAVVLLAGSRQYRRRIGASRR